ncbi:MAG TPA: DUF3147 family protein [Caulobacteraceae bacterium]|jgi:hypothetical protein|nr:DUF3147 family protein [Caulobacteraceae bacterium]
MAFLILRAAISGVLVALVAALAKRFPGWGGLVASLPMVSTLAMIWLWSDSRDTAKVATYSESAFWFVLPSLPMFLIIPMLMKRGLGFWPALAAGCVSTMALYAAMVWLAPRVGLKL